MRLRSLADGGVSMVGGVASRDRAVALVWKPNDDSNHGLAGIFESRRSAVANKSGTRIIHCCRSRAAPLLATSESNARRRGKRFLRRGQELGSASDERKKPT